MLPADTESHMRIGKNVKAAVVLFIILCTFVALYFTRTPAGASYPVLGREMITEIGVVEDHRDALEFWIEKGIRNAVLVNIDAHDDMKRIPSGELRDLKETVQRRTSGELAVQGGTEGYLSASNANFIYGAAKLGIVRKVIWVVPSTYELFADSGDRLAALLKMYGFSSGDIQSFRLKNRRFEGTADGIPLIICDAGSLPDLNEPILLSVDVDFFPELIDNGNLRISDSLRQTFNALFQKGYAIRNALVAYSVSGGFLDARYRWVGDLVVDTLRIPGLNPLPDLPGRYSFLQRADLLLQMKRYKELLDHLSPLLTGEAKEPAAMLYAAQACQELGKTEQAFRWAETACLSDRRYCYGLPQLGTAVLDRSGLSAAERFFVRGYELYPDMDEGQFRFAMSLKKSGRLEDAIRYFNVFRKCYGPFPVDFYLAETFLLKGDEVSALRYYNYGRQEVTRNPSILTGFGDVRAIENAAVFYEKKGYERYAAELRECIGRTVYSR